MIVLKIIDVISTIYFTTRIGVQFEANPVARETMLLFGIVPGMILLFILLLPLMFFWFVMVNFMFNKHKWGWNIFKVIMIIIAIIIPINNFLSV
jgi:hypothetical protein